MKQKFPNALAAKKFIITGITIGMGVSISLMTTSAIAGHRIFDQGWKDVPAKFKSGPKVIRGRSRSVRARLNLLGNQETIILNLFDDTELTLVRDRIERKGKGRLVWIGHVEGNPDSEAILAVRRKAMMGTVRVGEDVYEIVYMGNRTHVVRQIDPDARAPHSDPIPVSDAEMAAAVAFGSLDMDSSPVISGAPADGTQIDLMVVYTPKARANAGGVDGIEAKILNAVAAANQAYLNSEIDMHLNVVHMAEVSYTETGDMYQSLLDLTGTGDGRMDDVHTLRDLYGADQVALISADSNYCGIAYQMQSLSTWFASYAFSVVHDDSKYNCLGGQTLAHELGHNQGNAHNVEDSGGAGITSYSYGWRECGVFRTVMSYRCSGEPTISNFSNPDVFYQGRPTGVADQADTARSMNLAASTVANFRKAVTSSVPDAPSNLGAVATSTSSIQLSWSDTDNETGFKLQRSQEGGSWTEIADLGSNTTSFTDNALNAGTSYSYRVLAYNSAGNSAWSNTASATTDEEVMAVPLAPSNLAASADSTSSIQLSWSDNSTDEDGFRLQRSLDGSSWTEITTLGSNITSFTDNGLNAGTTYYYRVQAYNGAGNSAWSKASATTDTNNTEAADTVPPSVDIIKPEDGSRVRRRVRIKAIASDNVEVAGVELYIDGVLKASGVSSLNYTWRTRRVSSGAHTIEVKARDAAGNQSSQSVTVYKR